LRNPHSVSYAEILHVACQGLPVSPLSAIRASPGYAVNFETPVMSILLVGFDSAWTASNCGALVGLLHCADEKFKELGRPRNVDYHDAEVVILKWQAEHAPTATIVMLDQPTIVTNIAGQRPVENLVGSPVSLRYGGMQPANTSRLQMFGKDAPSMAVFKPFWRGRGPPRARDQDTSLRNLPGSDYDCPGVDASRCPGHGAAAQIQPKATKNIFDLGLEARLRSGVSRTARARTQRYR